MGKQLINNLIFCSIIGTSSLIAQALLPIMYVSKFDLFIIYIIAMALMGITILTWIPILVLRHTIYGSRIRNNRIAIAFGAGSIPLLLTLILFGVYSVVAGVSSSFLVIKNMINLLMIQFIIFIPLQITIVILLAKSLPQMTNQNEDGS